MKLTIFASIFSILLLRFVSAACGINNLNPISIISNCINPTWTFIYKGLDIKEIIDTYEKNPTFIISVADLASGRIKEKVRSWGSDSKHTLILNLDLVDIQALLTCPFRNAPICETSVEQLISHFNTETRSILKYIVVPLHTPLNFIRYINSNTSVSVIYHKDFINSNTKFGSFPLRDFIFVDLERSGLEFIVKLGKYLDETGNELVTLQECLNEKRFILNPERTSVAFATKLFLFTDMLVDINDGIQWHIDRENLILDSFQKWETITPERFLERIRISFINEPAYDAGGLTKDWFSEITKHIFGPDAYYFEAVKSDRYYTTPKSRVFELGIPGLDFRFLRFMGSFLAKVILNNQFVHVDFPNYLLKRLTGQKVHFHDFAQTHPEIFNSFRQLDKIEKSESTSDFYYGDFTYLTKSFKDHDVKVNLVPTNPDLKLTLDNKYQYMRLRFDAEVYAPHVCAFVKGFKDTMGTRSLKNFKVDELRQLISGPIDIDVQDWKDNTTYSGGYTPDSPQIVQFWTLIESFNTEMRRKLLKFVTGTSTVPFGGFAYLNPKFIIYRKATYYSRLSHVPEAHTCFNTLDLPTYDSEEILVERITNTIILEGFSMN